MDIRREMELINRRLFDKYQADIGEAVVWFEFDSTTSTYDHVYDEDSMEGGRAYRPGVLVPVLWITESDDPETYTPDGRRPTPTLRFTVPGRKLVDCGISNPVDSARHLNDIVIYRGQYWAIGDYQTRGRLRENLMVGVNATHIMPDDEMALATLPELNGLGQAQRPIGYPNNSYDTQTFPHHEAPARQAPP